MPAPTSDPRLAEVERYRKRDNAKRVWYAILEVNNTRGTEDMYVEEVVTAQGGVTQKYEGVRGWAEDWVYHWEKNRVGEPGPDL